MDQSLVTIILISYNHALYVEQALNSVSALSYPNVELIVADDASTDNSQQKIKELLKGKDVEIIFNTNNLGHCKTFNQALGLATGEFVVDLSADDVLMENSISEGVKLLKKMGNRYGVFFADAQLIDEQDGGLGEHKTTSFFKHGKVPTGNIYKNVLSKYFISPPTMIMRKSILDEMGGFDESLNYEDFDFWVRSSRITNYCYLPIITVKKRVHPDSASSKQYIRNSQMLASTLKVCRKAYGLNQTKAEDVALLKRLAYESKMAISSSNFGIAIQMIMLAMVALLKIRT